jgi:predicted DNA binding CopG/RHH family protein
MKDKAEIPAVLKKRDVKVKMYLSDEEIRLLKKKASKHKLSVSAYVRMIIFKGRRVRKDPL